MMNSCKSKLKELFSLDIRSLALFRMGLALVVLWDLFVRTQDLTAFYTDDGVLPRSLLINILNDWNYTINLMSGLWQIQLVLVLVTAAFALALLVGYKTRIATIATWFFLLSLQLRNPIILQGGDNALKLFLFWGMFLPLEACWSLDMRLKKSKSPANQVLSGGTVALILQICFIYWFAALLKNDPAWRSSATAVWYSLSIEQYSTELGRYLLNYPLFLKAITHITFYLEAFGTFLAFSPFWTGPLRLVTVAVFISFHVGLALTMELAHFPYICAVGWLAFLPPFFWNRVLKKGEAITYGKATAFSNLIAAFFISYIFLWNVHTLKVSIPIYSNFRWIGNLFGVDQQWNMFSPYPITLDGWYVIPGKLMNGKTIDLFSGSNQVTWDKPPLLSATYKNDRWRSYLMNLILHEYDDTDIFFAHYAHYLCTQWNETHSDEQNLVSLEIFYIAKINDYELPSSKDYEKELIWHHECLD